MYLMGAHFTKQKQGLYYRKVKISWILTCMGTRFTNFYIYQIIHLPVKENLSKYSSRPVFAARHPADDGRDTSLFYLARRFTSGLVSPKARFRVLFALVIVITFGIMLPYRNITVDFPFNKTEVRYGRERFVLRR